MSNFVIRVILLCALFCEVWWAVEASRILVVVSSPMISHQVVFQPFTQELVRRGHQVVVLTTDPAFPLGQAPLNLTEIDLHDISYKLWTDRMKHVPTGKESNYNTQLKMGLEMMTDVFQKQMQSREVRDLLSDRSQQFDLVVTEAWVNQALALAHIYHAPAILMSSLGIQDEIYEHAGVPVHPILYPDIRRTRRYNLSLWEQARTLYNRFEFHRALKSSDEKDDVVIRGLFGENVPPLLELRKNVAFQFVNWHPMWEGFRPWTPNIVHLGGMNCVPPKELPEDLKTFLDSSKRGVIYMSFGNTVNSALLPPERLEVFARVFATLPYDVLWKCKAPRNFSSNVHTFSWLPQSDLLRHEKLVLFITQGGLQSTDEALRAGVPLLGIPLLADQWVNVENYERLGVGLGLDFYTLSESQLRKTIETLINDKIFRKRSACVGREMQDRAQSALARAVWGAERALRLRGHRMTTPPPPPLTWDGLAQALLLAALTVPVALIFLAIMLYKIFSSLKQKFVITYQRCVTCARDLSHTTQIYLQLN